MCPRLDTYQMIPPCPRFDTYQTPYTNEILKVFELALETLYGASLKRFHGRRKNAKLFLDALKKLELKGETELPWANQQPMAFRGTIRSFGEQIGCKHRTP